MTFSRHCLFLLLGLFWDEEPRAPLSALLLSPVKVLSWIAFEFPAFFFFFFSHSSKTQKLLSGPGTFPSIPSIVGVYGLAVQEEIR